MSQNIDDGLASISDFKEFMFRNIVPLEEMEDYKGDPLEKILYYWRKHELTPFIQKGKKARVSFAELIWLRMLDIFRQFGFPLARVKEVCDYFFKDAYFDNLPRTNLTDNKKLLEAKKLAGTITERELETLEFIDEILSDEALLYILKFDINYLTNLITSSLNSGEDRGVLIFLDGRVAEFDGKSYHSHRKSEKIDPTEPHIYISIVHILKDFIKSSHLSEMIVPQLLNDDEKAVLRELKARNLSELTIRFKNGQVETLEATMTGLLEPGKMQMVKEVLGLNNYESIELKTRDEKTISFKRTKKKKNKDSD